MPAAPHADRILVADLGGTHCRLALARVAGRRVSLSAFERCDTVALEDAVAAIAEFAARRLRGTRPRAAAIGVAGPAVDGHTAVALTNRPLTLDATALAGALKLPRVLLVNDFAAVAAAVPLLGAADLRWHRPDGALQAPCAVLGAGTGLGVSVWLGDDRVLAGEGGHVQLAPADEREREAFSWLADTEGFVAAEDLLSGRGLARLYRALCALDQRPITGVEPEEVARRARQGEAQAQETLARFTAALGRVAGDVALTVGSRCVLIAGGIVPAWGSAFDVAGFRHAFEAKGRYRDYLQRVASGTVLHPQPALLGLARLAAAELRRSRRRSKIGAE